MKQKSINRYQIWKAWWKQEEIISTGLPIEHFRLLFLRFGTYGTLVFVLLMMALTMIIRVGSFFSPLHWHVTELDMWQMICVFVTWTPLGLGLLHFLKRIPLGLYGVIIILYWSIAVTSFNSLADIANGTVVIYHAILIITASFILPSRSCLVLAAIFSAVMVCCSWISHTSFRLFDIAGLVLVGYFSWFSGNVLDASYHSLHEINSSLIEANRSLEIENQQRANLETELRESVATAEKANRLKSQFMANITHEIRTPLTSIIGYTLLLQRTRLEPQQIDYLGIVRRCSDLLLSVLNDILDISKIESQQLKLENIDFDLEYVIQSVTEIIRERIRNKLLTLQIEYPAALPRCFKGDPTRMRQILLNLLGNAVKFTEKGMISVEVREEGAEPSPAAVVHRMQIIVRDTGIGIPAERQQDIFKPFVQGDGSTTRKYGGTGLGLSITQELVERMGGTITLTSQVGQGSAFSVCLPLPAGKPVSGKDFNLLSFRDLNSVGTLLVENIPEDQALLMRYLQDLGLRVACAVARPDEALDWLDQHADDVSLVLCDIRLMAEAGVTFAQKVRQRRDGKRFKLVAVNLDAQPSHARVAREEGFDGYLSKPFSPSEFSHVVLGVLGDRRREQNQIVTQHLMKELELHAISILALEETGQATSPEIALLQTTGCQLEVVTSWNEVINRMRSQAYDLILMNLQTLSEDALKVTEKIRQNLKQTIPIIAMTVHAQENDVAACLKAGLNEHLSKPIELEQLKSTILTWIKH